MTKDTTPTTKAGLRKYGGMLAHAYAATYHANGCEAFTVQEAAYLLAADEANLVAAASHMGLTTADKVADMENFAHLVATDPKLRDALLDCQG